MEFATGFTVMQIFIFLPHGSLNRPDFQPRGSPLMEQKMLLLSPILEKLLLNLGLILSIFLIHCSWQLRNDTKDLGFDITFIQGYTNDHLGYFCTPNEYDIGGYER